jgi:branched-chain amino acid transport system permease protein
MEIFTQQLFNGIVLGSVYAMVAVGYTMVYGILQLINFAHGEVLMVGAMLGLSFVTFVTVLYPSLPAAFILIGAISVAAVACPILSATIERIAYKPLRKAPRLAPLITAIGVSIILQTLAMIIWGANPKVFPDLLPTNTFLIGGAIIAPKQLLILFVAFFSMVLLIFLVNKTTLGRAMRAVSESPSNASLLGISVDSVIRITFMLGAILAGVAGVLVALNYNFVHFTMGFLLGLKAFTAAVLGGIGNIAGAVLGGLLLGVIESLGAGYIGDFTNGFLGSHYQDIFSFVILIIVLLFKPTGILGEKIADRA